MPDNSSGGIGSCNIPEPSFSDFNASANVSASWGSDVIAVFWSNPCAANDAASNLIKNDLQSIQNGLNLFDLSEIYHTSHLLERQIDLFAAWCSFPSTKSIGHSLLKEFGLLPKLIYNDILKISWKLINSEL